MKKFNSKTLIIYIFLTLYIALSFTPLYTQYNNIIRTIIFPSFWIVTFLICLFINTYQTQKIHYQTPKLQTIFIIVTIYLILYFVSGLFLGYSKSIYSHSLIGILKNIWIYFIPIIFIEYTRKTIITQNTGIFFDITAIIIFTLIDTNLLSIISLNSYIEIFKNISSIFIPSLTLNILLTYLIKTCGYYATLCYRLPQTLVALLLPILPSLNWYYTSILGIILPLIVYLAIRNINIKKEKRNFSRLTTHQNIFLLSLWIIPLLLLILFVSGVFQYKPMAILSNSMYPIFQRGDIVISQKITQNNIKQLKKYDIIEYKLDNRIITHRIIHIDKQDGNTLYTTMGDNNNIPDLRKVKEDQVIAKVIFSIPKIGYPSVFLNDLLNKNKQAPVEIGNKKGV